MIQMIPITSRVVARGAIWEDMMQEAKRLMILESEMLIQMKNTLGDPKEGLDDERATLPKTVSLAASMEYVFLKRERPIWRKFSRSSIR
jgi:hypothetical protein